MYSKERRSLKLNDSQYVLVIEVLFQRHFDGMLLRCIDFTKDQKVLQYFHEGIFCGQFAPTTTAHRITRVGYYWPTIFKHSYSMIKKCISCQNVSGKMKKVTMPSTYND
jgi:hypothetical protein